jgi:hypothetical protein
MLELRKVHGRITWIESSLYPIGIKRRELWSRLRGTGFQAYLEPRVI